MHNICSSPILIQKAAFRFLIVQSSRSLEELLLTPSNTAPNDDVRTIERMVFKLSRSSLDIIHKLHVQTAIHVSNKPNLFTCRRQVKSLRVSKQGSRSTLFDTSLLQCHQKSSTHTNLIILKLYIAHHSTAAIHLHSRSTCFSSAQETHAINKIKQVSNSPSLSLFSSPTTNLYTYLHFSLQALRLHLYCRKQTCR